ncbi:MAG: DUF3606 domain-containing protein [Patescibacteria group bacterium]|nr:DUF3606 domain-containing protein [Patescibacteria group bacterium]
MLSRNVLALYYLERKFSVSEIAKRLRCSEQKVNYWLRKHNIPKRSISDALYQKWNPDGDPFVVRQPKTVSEAVLYGLGVGLYWGEGTKASKGSIRLGNSDPALIRKFIEFLVRFYGIDRLRLRFGLQIFGDMDEEKSVHYWTRSLKVSRKQFHPSIMVTPHRGVGNYRKKSEHGVLTLYFNNTKLRDILCNAINEMAM